jgi:hypothetical protein
MAVAPANKILNLLDPPKDLSADSDLTARAHGDLIKPILLDMFWPGYNARNDNPPLPNGFTPIGDTKGAIKNSLGSESDSQTANKPLTNYLLNKANKLRILRETHTSGTDGRPSNLYVSQDSGPGPEKLIKNPTIIITPGTILDPASKTKEGATFLVKKFGTLAHDPYILNLNMGNIITDDITMSQEADGDPNSGRGPFRIQIPTNIGGAAAGLIDAYLNFQTFKKLAPTAERPNEDGDYFRGNPEKNNFILNNPTEVNKIKKYILVKELGDTLQVVWLKSILDAENDEDNEENPYTEENTVLITGDTVVWYRCMINKVPVIITYMGETNYWRSQDNEEFMIAAFKKTIREELISANQSVIKMITEVRDLPRTDDGRWLWGLSWTTQQRMAVTSYLAKLIPKLEALNKDALIFIDNVPSIDGAKSAAARYRLMNPFIKKGQEWRTNEKILSLLPDGNISFNGKAFKSVNSIVSNLQNSNLFIQFPTTGGSFHTQRGGTRRTVLVKERQARSATTVQLQDTYYTNTITEFTDSASVTLPQRYRDEWHEIIERVDEATQRRNQHIVGVPLNFTEDDNWGIFSANSRQITELGARRPNDHVLYLFIREMYPEIFTYAAMMKTAMDELAKPIARRGDVRRLVQSVAPTGLFSSLYRFIDSIDAVISASVNILPQGVMTDYATYSAKFPNVSLDLKSKYTIDYTYNERDEMLIPRTDEPTAITTLTASKEALFLANKFITYFDYFPSQELANFVSFCLNNRAIFTGEEDFDFPFRPNNYNYALSLYQVGGGEYESELLPATAVDLYELYFNSYAKAAYEDKSMTDKEFQAIIEKNKQDSLIVLIKDMFTKALQTPAQFPVMKTGIGPENRLLMPEYKESILKEPIYGIGGKFKSSRKHKRGKTKQTRKHRNKK